MLLHAPPRMGRGAQRFAFACASTSPELCRSSSEHLTQPRAALCAPLSSCRSRLGLCPLRLLLNRLRRFSRIPAGEQFSAEVVALPFGLFASQALLIHPLAQRTLSPFAAGTFGVELFAELSQLARSAGALRRLSRL